MAIAVRSAWIVWQKEQAAAGSEACRCSPYGPNRPPEERIRPEVFPKMLSSNSIVWTRRNPGWGRLTVNGVVGNVRKTTAVLGSALFFVAAPFLAAAAIPWWITRWDFQPAFFGTDLTRAIGGLLVVSGVPGVVDSFARFALDGLGTPAPVAPPQHLVVTGLYRYVRNPMYVSVLAAICGQALLFGDWRLIVYGALFWLACHVFVTTYEEPALQRSFGAEYATFRANVPRWVPRLTPWEGG